MRGREQQSASKATKVAPGRRATVPHYRPPGVAARRFNAVVRWLTARGLSVWGSRVIEVRGRTSGRPRRTVVNLLALNGRRYLVSPRGDAEWVRNLRAAGGEVTLQVGRRRERCVANELDDAAKPDVLRAYLARWQFEVGVFFDGVSASSAPEALAAIASRHPVFVLEGR